MKLLAATVLASTVATTACLDQTTPKRPQPATSTARAEIARVEIERAQRTWCDSLVAISAEFARNGDATKIASDVLSKVYNYDGAPVLFKPTLTHDEQTFRMDKRGALAYFVGGDSAYTDDKGFARNGWVSCEPTIAGVFAQGDVALAMGNVTLKNAKGDVVKVDKSFGYVRDADGLKIVLHHSSLPYKPGT